MNWTRAPEVLWCYAMESIAEICEVMAGATQDIRPPVESILGNVQDILEYIEFDFHRFIKFMTLIKANSWDIGCVENSSSRFFQISCSQGILNSSRLSCYLLLRLLVYMYLSQLMRTFTNYLKCIVI